MVAERLTIGNSLPVQQRTQIYRFATEVESDEFVRSLLAIGVTAPSITVLAMALERHKTIPLKRLRDPQKAPHFARYTLFGAVFGGVLAALGGLYLQQNDFLALSWMESFVIYFLALFILCAVLGGTLGAVLAAYQVQPPDDLPMATTEGALVIIKAPDSLQERCQLIAQSIGVEKINL